MEHERKFLVDLPLWRAVQDKGISYPIEQYYLPDSGAEGACCINWGNPELIRITTPDEQEIDVIIPKQVMEKQAASINALRSRLTPDSELRTGKAEGVSVRIRQIGETFLMTLKGDTPDPEKRHEVEFGLSAEISPRLKPFCPGGVEKTRHEILHHGHTWEVDVFTGENTGLIMAELENPPKLITKPVFVGREVTRDGRYSNQALAHRPFSQWSEAEKQSAMGTGR